MKSRLFGLVLALVIMTGLVGFSGALNVDAMSATPNGNIIAVDGCISNGTTCQKDMAISGGEVTIVAEVYGSVGTQALVKIPYQLNQCYRYVGSEFSGSVEATVLGAQSGYFVWSVKFLREGSAQYGMGDFSLKLEATCYGGPYDFTSRAETGGFTTVGPKMTLTIEDLLVSKVNLRANSSLLVYTKDQNGRALGGVTVHLHDPMDRDYVEVTDPVHGEVGWIQLSPAGEYTVTLETELPFISKTVEGDSWATTVTYTLEVIPTAVTLSDFNASPDTIWDWLSHLLR